MLISISVRLKSGTCVRPVGLCDVDESYSLMTVYGHLSKGLLNTGDRFLLPDKYVDCTVSALVSFDRDRSQAQSCPMTAHVSAVKEFGKFLTFQLDDTQVGASASTVALPNAFDVLRQRQMMNVWPKLYQITRPNARHKLHNDVVNWLQGIPLGWNLQVKSLGDNFVRVLCDTLWMVDPHRVTMASRGCPLPDGFMMFQGYNRPAAHNHVSKSLTRDECHTQIVLIGNILEQAWINTERWTDVRKMVEGLRASVQKYAEYLAQQQSVTFANHHAVEKVCHFSDTMMTVLLPLNKTLTLNETGTLLNVMGQLEKSAPYEAVHVTDHLPIDSRLKHNAITMLKRVGLPIKCMLYTYSPGGSSPNLHFLWKLPESAPEEEIRNKTLEITSSLEKDCPVYMSRQIRKNFVDKFGRLTHAKPAFLREMFRQLTNDASAAETETTLSIDKRVRELLTMEDESIIVDLREHNPGRPSKYEPFFEEAEKYINDVVGTAVQERRHDSITYLATAMSVRHLVSNVEQRLRDQKLDVPIPSTQWVRLQFWPKDPTRKSSLQYTGRLNVKYMIQQRQLRKEHEDCHYASAYLRYMKEMAIRFRDYATFVSMDDKHKVKVEEPGCPVAAVERGKQVIVGRNQTFAVADHDFTKLTLIPSVTFFIEIPQDIEGSFYGGQVYVGVKDSVIEGSTPLRHLTELYELNAVDSPVKNILLQYSDGGPDHRVNTMSVQLAIISLFLRLDLDAYFTLRTPPGHSWKNMAERVMSILNFALQSVGVMRREMVEEMEELLRGCGSVSETRKTAEQQPLLRPALVDSLQQPIELLSSLFEHLELKGQPFKTYTGASVEEMDAMAESLAKIDPSLSPNTSRVDAMKIPAFKAFFEAHCVSRWYYFGVKKCSNVDCEFHGLPQTPPDVFRDLHFLPDPQPMTDGNHYRPFEELYGSQTTERHRPSLTKGAAQSHGLPFSPTAQTAGRVGLTILCEVCDKPRVLHAAKKLKPWEKYELQIALDDADFSCGAIMQDFVPEDDKEDNILCKVYVRSDLQCNMPVEKTYFSAGNSIVCIHCATAVGLVVGEQARDLFPTCKMCFDAKPRMFKPKRKLVQ